jgi:hypothetical protein
MVPKVKIVVKCSHGGGREGGKSETEEVLQLIGLLIVVIDSQVYTYFQTSQFSLNIYRGIFECQSYLNKVGFFLSGNKNRLFSIQHLLLYLIPNALQKKIFKVSLIICCIIISHFLKKPKVLL